MPISLMPGGWQFVQQAMVGIFGSPTQINRTVTTYVGDSTTVGFHQDSPKSIDVPGAKVGQTGSPAGQVFNSAKNAFPCQGLSFASTRVKAASKFLIVTEDGTLQCWTENGSNLNKRMKSFHMVFKHLDLSIKGWQPVTLAD